MKVGLMGLPGSGRKTLFQLLTGIQPSHGVHAGAPASGMATVPDSRVDFFVSHFHPKKVSRAQIAVEVLPALGDPQSNAHASGGRSSSGAGGKGTAQTPLLEAVRDADALLYVVRAFESATVAHVAGSLDPMRDLEQMHSELLLADWSLVETRLERLSEAKRKGKPADPRDVELLERCREALEHERPLSTVDFDNDEEDRLRAYTFLTRSPVVVVVNVDEDQFQSGTYPGADAVSEWANRHDVPLITVCGKLEMEIEELEGEEKSQFLSDLGITERGIVRVARTLYDHLGAISYFTVGEDEVKAWTIRRGMNAQEAAGRIHSDIARGFIRAEVVSYEAFRATPSIAKLKESGDWRLEGKTYIVKDGDIMNFRFNV